MNTQAKAIIIGTILLASNILSGLLWKDIPQHPWYALSVLLSSVLWILFAMIAGDKPKYYAFAPLSMISIGIALGSDIWTLVGVVVSSLLSVYALYEAKRQLSSHTKISARHIAGDSLRMFLTSLAFLFSFYYFGIALKTTDTNQLLLPADIFNIAMRVAEKPMQSILPGVSANSTVDDALALFVREQLRQNKNIQDDMLPPVSEIKKMISPQRKEIIRTMNEELGLNIDVNTPGTAKVSSVIYKLAGQTINQYTSPFSTYVPWIIAAGFFISLKTVGFFYYYIAMAIASMIIKILLVTGIFKKEIITAQKETLL